MHVYLTGATGFVGSYILRALRQRGHTVRCLSRRETPGLEREGVEAVQGNVADPSTLTDTMKDCDAVIHLVGILQEHPAKGVTFESIHHQGTRHVIEEATRTGINQFVLMSANGARPHAPSDYHTTKWKAEEALREADFEQWTIFRPSTIYGDPGLHADSFEVVLARTLVKPFPILPIFGDGRYLMQPVSVEEVAQGFAQALEMSGANGRVYPVGGPQTYSFNRVTDIIAETLGGNPKPKFHIPLWIARPMVELFGRFNLLPITPAQLQMLVEGNTCDPTEFYRDFDVQPAAFAPKNLSYLRGRV